MAIRTCENCERDIGHLEPELLWQGKAVCPECHRRLLAAMQPAAFTYTAAVRRPKKPWPLWLAVGLFALSVVPMSLELVKMVTQGLGDPQAAEKMLAGSGGGMAMSLIELTVGVVNMVGFVVAWRGYGWGAWAALATAAVMVAMELGGQSFIGLPPTPLYILALVLMMAGFGCMLLPPAWAYYRASAAWRQSQR